MVTPPKTLISPRFPPEKLESPSLDDLVDVFEDRLQGWLLAPTKKLLSDPIEQFAGFALSLSYFEGISIYLQGRDSAGRSRGFFRHGFVDVFRSSGQSAALLERVADVLYEDARCGFFHDAMIRTRVYLGDYFDGPIAITLPNVNGKVDATGEIQSIVVHGPKYFEYLEGHLRKYVARLRDPAQQDTRDRFKAACDLKWAIEDPPRVVAL